VIEFGDPRLPQRFWKKVERITSGCWIWTGALAGHGYGQIRVNRKGIYAHRWIFEVDQGSIKKGLQIDHLCRNRSCVNPTHLEAVTQQVNITRGDMGSGVRIGSGNPNAKISDQQVLEIDALYASGHLQREIAIKFGYTQGQISRILNRKAFRNVGRP